jgi:hypothetical protein
LTDCRHFRSETDDGSYDTSEVVTKTQQREAEAFAAKFGYTLSFEEQYIDNSSE